MLLDHLAELEDYKSAFQQENGGLPQNLKVSMR